MLRFRGRVEHVRVERILDFLRTDTRYDRFCELTPDRKNRHGSDPLEFAEIQTVLDLTSTGVCCSGTTGPLSVSYHLKSDNGRSNRHSPTVPAESAREDSGLLPHLQRRPRIR